MRRQEERKQRQGFEDQKPWKSKCAKFRDLHKMPAGTAPWTTRTGVRLRGLLGSARQRELLDIIFIREQQRLPKLTTRELVKGLYANVSQCVTRMPSSRGHLPTPTTNSCVYSYEFDCVLSSEAAARGMGWPTGFCPREVLSPTQLRSLVGESFSVPIIAQLSYIMYMNPHGPWWQQSSS